MKAETADYLAKARAALADAHKIAALPLPQIAAREAYVAVFHAAEAYIFEQTEVPTSRERDAHGKGKEHGTVGTVGRRPRTLKMLITNEQEFHRYTISLADFEKASARVAEARKRLPNDLVYESLLFMAIITYCRPFSTNEKSKSNLKAKSRLSLDDLIVPSDREKEIHTECETLRNKALAHSEFAYNPTSLNPIAGVISSKAFSLLTQPFDLGGLAKLLKKFEEACHSKRATYVLRSMYAAKQSEGRRL